MKGPKRKAALTFIIATVVIDMLGVGLAWPILPQLVKELSGQSFAESAFIYGLLMSGFAAVQFLVSPFIGMLSDRYGRRPILLISLVGLGVDYIILALAPNLWWLVVARIFAGVFSATVSTANAYIADITPKEERAARFGMIGAAFGVGFVLGPAIGGLTATWGVSAPFWVAAVIAGANVIFGLIVLPESLPVEKRRRFEVRDVNPFGIVVRAFKIPGLPVPLLASFVVECANMVYVTLWAFWGREVFGWSTKIIGVSLSAYGILIVLSQAVVMPYAVAWLGERKLTIYGLILAAITLTGFGFTSAVWTLAVLLPMAALSDLVPPTLSAMAANATDDDSQGMVQGVISSLAAIAAVLSPLVYPPIFGAFVGEEAALYLPGAPYVFAALLVVLALFLVLRQRPAGDVG